LIAVYHN